MTQNHRCKHMVIVGANFDFLNFTKCMRNNIYQGPVLF